MSRSYNLKRSKPDARDFKFAHVMSPVAGVKLPSAVDLRSKCPSVYDQGELGSCTANAGCAALAMLKKTPATMFSRLFLYYWERFIENTVSDDSGADMRDIGKALQQYGCCLEKSDPYDITKFTSKPTDAAQKEANGYKVRAYHSIENLDGIKQALALKQQPVLIGIDVFESFESDAVAKSGVVPMPRKGEQNLGGHAVLAVGYKDAHPVAKFFHSLMGIPSKGYLIVRNSWGVNWGQKGYFLLPYEYISGGFSFDFWVLDN